MREIKIRFFNKQNKRWLKLDDILESSLYLENFGNPFKDEELIPVEFTGLKDSKRTKEFPKGQEIYEGDVVQDEHLILGFIAYNKGSFYVNYSKYNHLLGMEDKIEVIGNIYENSELLKKVKQ